MKTNLSQIRICPPPLVSFLAIARVTSRHAFHSPFNYHSTRLSSISTIFWKKTFHHSMFVFETWTVFRACHCCSNHSLAVLFPKLPAFCLLPMVTSHSSHLILIFPSLFL